MAGKGEPVHGRQRAFRPPDAMWHKNIVTLFGVVFSLLLAAMTPHSPLLWTWVQRIWVVKALAAAFLHRPLETLALRPPARCGLSGDKAFLVLFLYRSNLSSMLPRSRASSDLSPPLFRPVDTIIKKIFKQEGKTLH